MFRLGVTLPAPPLQAVMTTSPRPALSCCSGGTQAGPRAPAWGPQLPPPPPPHLLPVPCPAPRLPAVVGPEAGVPPRRPPCADAEGEGAAMRPGAGDPLCEYRPCPASASKSSAHPRALWYPWRSPVLSQSSLAGASPQLPVGVLSDLFHTTSEFRSRGSSSL